MELFGQAEKAWGAGDMPVVSKKTSQAFNAEFENKLLTDPQGALTLVNQQMLQAGEVFEGPQSFTRRMATDLVGTDVKNAYLIPMGDASIPERARMVQNAAKFKSITAEGKVPTGTFQSAFAAIELRNGLQAINDVSPIMYEGIKQAIFHEAAASVTEKGDVMGAVSKAAERMKGMYNVIPGPNGSTIFTLDKEGGEVNYKERRLSLFKGAESAITLPMMTREEKIDLIERRLPQVKLTRNPKDNSVMTPDHAIDFQLKAIISIKPDAKYANMHTLNINGQPIMKRNGDVVKVSAQDLIKYGSVNTTQPPVENKAQTPNMFQFK